MRFFTRRLFLLAIAFFPQACRSQSPTANPEQLRVSFGEDPTAVVRVVWQTSGPCSNPVVEYGPSEKLGLTANAHRETYKQETGYIWEATLSGLRPNRVYWYSAGEKGGPMSASRSFRTAPRNPSEFVFTAFGDHGISPEAVKNCENILREKPVFHMILGDVSYANGNQPIWDDYLRQVEILASAIPFMLTLGNHENERITRMGMTVERIGYVSYLARFALPGNERWYSFDIGPARFVVFNSDDYANPDQFAWLETTLQDARKSRRIEWIIVCQHHPLFGTSRGRGDNKGLIQKVQPIFDRYKVDLVLAGHDHHYERQFPLRGDVVTSRDRETYRRGEGTLYVVQGGGGKSLYDFDVNFPDMLCLREKSYGYLRVTVRKGGPLTVEAKRLDGSIIEQFEIIP